MDTLKHAALTRQQVTTCSRPRTMLPLHSQYSLDPSHSLQPVIILGKTNKHTPGPQSITPLSSSSWLLEYGGISLSFNRISSVLDSL